jgi:exodeoxyribonuclease VII large subunit
LQTSGHSYFSLKDSTAVISAALFKGVASKIRFPIKDGLAVIVSGEISVYPPKGGYQIIVKDIQLKGQGSLQEQFEKLKQKLALEGLFDIERKKPLPRFPETVAIVTSPTGAAIRDFIHVLKRRCPRIRLQVYGVKVQGAGAAEEIVRAMELINEAQEADVIVLARGGGSLEDLWCFNEEKVARAIAASDIPTISGVGNEIDFTISDFVSDLRAPTPSAAAELVSAADDDWKNTLETIDNRLTRYAKNLLSEIQWKLKRYQEHYVFREPQRILEKWMQRVDDLNDTLQKELVWFVQQRRNDFSLLAQRFQKFNLKEIILMKKRLLAEKEKQLKILSPQSALNRGFALVFDEKGGLVRTVKNALAQKNLKVRLSDGDVNVQTSKD